MNWGIKSRPTASRNGKGSYPEGEVFKGEVNAQSRRGSKVYQSRIVVFINYHSPFHDLYAELTCQLMVFAEIFWDESHNY